MKSSFAFWITTGTGTGAVIGMTYDNLQAGLCFGMATGIIISLISWLNLRHSNHE